MLAQNGSVLLQTGPAHGQVIIAAAALLLRAERHERDGLSRSGALLTAVAELGADPAAVLRYRREVAE